MARTEIPKSLAALRHEYRPYDKLEAFDQGFEAYGKSKFKNPYSDSEDARAWDHGLECAARWTREQQAREPGDE